MEATVKTTVKTTEQPSPVDEWRELYKDHRYIRLIASNGDIYYSEDFYPAMYDKMKGGNMNAVEAYNALGLDTGVLGEARANSAGTRAVKMMEKEELFRKNPGNYDSSATFEEMVKIYSKGDMDRDDVYANMAARLIYLEETVKRLKKTSLLSGETKK